VALQLKRIEHKEIRYDQRNNRFTCRGARHSVRPHNGGRRTRM
jgi:hypothetical protein